MKRLFFLLNKFIKKRNLCLFLFVILDFLDVLLYVCIWGILLFLSDLSYTSFRNTQSKSGVQKRNHLKKTH